MCVQIDRHTTGSKHSNLNKLFFFFCKLPFCGQNKIPGRKISSACFSMKVIFTRYCAPDVPFGASVGCGSNVIGTFRFNFTDALLTTLLIIELISECYHVVGGGSTSRTALPLRRAQPQPLAWRHFTAITFQKIYTQGERGGGTVA